MKTLFLIPGSGQKPSDTCFKWLISFLKKKGFNVIGVPIKWERRVMPDYVSQFKEFYLRHKTKNDYLLGFSYGAVIAFMSASDLKPKKIYLCSLSPDFKEDVKAIKPWWIRSFIGKRRFADIKTRSARKVAKALKIPAVVFYGEAEGKRYPQLKKRCEETVRLAKNAKLVVVKNAPHKIDYPEYMAAIKKEFEKL